MWIYTQSNITQANNSFIDMFFFEHTHKHFSGGGGGITTFAKVLVAHLEKGITLRVLSENFRFCKMSFPLNFDAKLRVFGYF